jgi:two-component system NtrC family sensor kinase
MTENILRLIEFVMDVTKTRINVIDSDFNLTYVDPGWQKIYGDYSGRKCHEYFMGNNKVCEGCGALKAFKTKERCVTEEIMSKEGGLCVQVTSIPFKDEQNRWFCAEVNVDITELKKKEVKIKESENKFRSLFELSQDAMMTLSAPDLISPHAIKRA